MKMQVTVLAGDTAAIMGICSSPVPPVATANNQYIIGRPLALLKVGLPSPSN